MCFQDASASAVEGSLVNRMLNKRKSVAIPVDLYLRRSIQSVDEVYSYISLSLYFLL